MKLLMLPVNVLISTVSCLFSLDCYSQSNKVEPFHQLTRDILVRETDESADTTSRPRNIQAYAPRGAVFTFLGRKKGVVLIRFWEWKKPERKLLNFRSSDDSSDITNFKKAFNGERNTISKGEKSVSPQNEKIFFLTEEDFENNTRVYYNKTGAWSMGTMFTPIKLRRTPFDFSKDFTIGPAIGYRKRISHFNESYFNFAFGAGISSITLDSASTNGSIKSSNRSAFTPAIGLGFEFGSASISITSGIDMLSFKEPDKVWIHNRQLWIGIGMGVTLFEKKGEDKAEGKNTISR